MVAKDISGLSDILRPIVGKIIERFKNNGGDYKPHRPTMAVIGGGKGGLKFGASGGRKSVKARTFAGRKTMMVNRQPEN